MKDETARGSMKNSGVRAWLLARTSMADANALALRGALRIAGSGNYVTHAAVLSEVMHVLGPLAHHVDLHSVPALVQLAHMQRCVDGFVLAFVDSRPIAALRDLEDELPVVLASFGLSPLHEGACGQPPRDDRRDPAEIDLENDQQDALGACTGPPTFDAFGLGPLCAHPLVRLKWQLNSTRPPAASLSAAAVLAELREYARSTRAGAREREGFCSHLCARHGVSAVRELGVIVGEVRPLLLMASHAWRREQQLLAAAFNTALTHAEHHARQQPRRPSRRGRQRRSSRDASAEADGGEDEEEVGEEEDADAAEQALEMTADVDTPAAAPASSPCARSMIAHYAQCCARALEEAGHVRPSAAARAVARSALRVAMPSADPAPDAGDAPPPAQPLSDAEGSALLDVAVAYALQSRPCKPATGGGQAPAGSPGAHGVRAERDGEARAVCDDDDRACKRPRDDTPPGPRTCSRRAALGPDASLLGALESACVSVTRPLGGGPVRVPCADVQACLPLAPPPAPGGAAREQQLRAVGRWGEALVYQLLLLTRPGATVNWVNEREESGLGYDLELIEGGGKITYVEVKSTRHARSNVFHLTRREWELACKMGDAYHIYRVYSAAEPSAVVVEHLVDPARMLDTGQVALCLAI